MPYPRLSSRFIFSVRSWFVVAGFPSPCCSFSSVPDLSRWLSCASRLAPHDLRGDIAILSLASAEGKRQNQVIRPPTEKRWKASQRDRSESIMQEKHNAARRRDRSDRTSAWRCCFFYFMPPYLPLCRAASQLCFEFSFERFWCFWRLQGHCFIRTFFSTFIFPRFAIATAVITSPKMTWGSFGVPWRRCNMPVGILAAWMPPFPSAIGERIRWETFGMFCFRFLELATPDPVHRPKICPLHTAGSARQSSGWTSLGIDIAIVPPMSVKLFRQLALASWTPTNGDSFEGVGCWHEDPAFVSIYFIKALPFSVVEWPQ